MADPLRRLKHLPWRSLLQVSGLTILIIIFLELFLSVAYSQSLALRRLLSVLSTPPLGTVMLFAIAVGVGVLSVYLLERFHPRLFLNNATLWALVPCLVFVVVLKLLLPVPPLLMHLNLPQLMGMVVGIFAKGRPYWR